MKKAPLLITGAGGQLASDLLPLLHETVGIGPVISCNHQELDISDVTAVLDRVQKVQPWIVINLAAYNLVDKAEVERELAFRVNADGPRHLAKACLEVGAKLVQVSTDHVFGRDAFRRTPYSEGDETGPVSVYGESKLAGEQAVLESGCPHLIIRTCGLYGSSATRVKGNFVTTIRRLAKERDELRVVNDQFCTPSWTRNVAQGILRLIAIDVEGIVNVTNSGEASWYDVAREIVKLDGLPTRVIPISTLEYAAPARRPSYSVLSTEKFAGYAGEALDEWNTALRRFLRSPD